MADIRSLLDLMDAPMWTPEKSLATIETMVHGYNVALHAHGILEPAIDFNSRFYAFVYSRVGLSTSTGWAAALTRSSSSGDEAWEKGFVLLDEFRRHHTGTGASNEQAG